MNGYVEVQFQQDLEIYSRLFSEIFLYLRQNKPTNDWRAVVLYPTRNLDTKDIKHYREFFASLRVSRIYLDELGEAASLPISIATIKLVIEDEDTAIARARELIERVNQGSGDEIQARQLLQLIETIIVYKFPNMRIEEIQAMFGLSDLKQTRVYQEGVEEGERKTNLKAIRRFLALGLSGEQIAEGLDLSIEEVRQAAQQQPDDQGNK